MGFLPDEDELERVKTRSAEGRAELERWQREANARFAPLIRELEKETYDKAVMLGVQPRDLPGFGVYRRTAFGGQKFMADSRRAITISGARVALLEDGTLVLDEGDWSIQYRFIPPDRRMGPPRPCETRESYELRCQDEFDQLVMRRRADLCNVAKGQ